MRKFTMWKESREANSYLNALANIETMVGNIKPYGFSADADDEMYRARKDVLQAISQLKRSANQPGF